MQDVHIPCLNELCTWAIQIQTIAIILELVQAAMSMIIDFV